MKKALVFMVGMMALCTRSATEAETRQIIRGYVEELDNVSKDSAGFERHIQVLRELRMFDKDVKMSVYFEMLAEKPDDPATVNRMIERFFRDDGIDVASCGNQQALGWARKALRDEGEGFNTYTAGMYLMMKGDARDLDIVGDGFRDALAMRVAGTNIINYSPPSSGMPAGSGWRGCTPSVTNTGPQGLYVEAILRQYWEKMEERNTAKVPPELLTLAVWFDDGGNPVCNVDLAKYGLTMPELDVPNRPMGKSGVRDEESGVKSEKSGTRRLWSLALIIPAALTALLLARRRRR